MRKEYDFSHARRGPVVPVPPGKTRITIRLDDDLIQWFKDQVHAASGGNYQSLINAAVREYVEKTRAAGGDAEASSTWLTAWEKTSIALD